VDKEKCRGGQEVVIGGWWGSSTKLRSLLVGVYQGEDFTYLGVSAQVSILRIPARCYVH